ncbi:hypothetical protein ON010_g16879 [Phytophthora cinnamomi]|nr:hypothetical protein ON010_g16879 [Phytophthora cinnamomi]
MLRKGFHRGASKLILRAWRKWIEATRVEQYRLKLKAQTEQHVQQTTKRLSSEHDQVQSSMRESHAQQLQRLMELIEEKDQELEKLKRQQRAEALEQAAAKSQWENDLHRFFESAVVKCDEQIAQASDQLEALLQRAEDDVLAARFGAAQFLVDCMLQQKILNADDSPASLSLLTCSLAASHASAAAPPVACQTGCSLGRAQRLSGPGAPAPQQLPGRRLVPAPAEPPPARPAPPPPAPATARTATPWFERGGSVEPVYLSGARIDAEILKIGDRAACGFEMTKQRRRQIRPYTAFAPHGWRRIPVQGGGVPRGVVPSWLTDAVCETRSSATALQYQPTSTTINQSTHHGAAASEQDHEHAQHIQPARGPVGAAASADQEDAATPVAERARPVGLHDQELLRQGVPAAAPEALGLPEQPHGGGRPD